MLEEKNLEKQLFNEALELTVEGRSLFLKGACRGDAKLLERVEQLLRAHDDSGAVLETREETLEDVVPMTEGPGTVIGRYKLLQKIGEGGFGVVYMARQSEPVKRDVALKIIKLGMDTRQVVGRFEAERQALAMMDHPNIAKVLDAGASESGRPYFVMELVRGVPITRYCDDHSIPTDQRLDLFVLVCRAVQHAHQKGIIHRDIKPSNVLITMHDGIPVPKVIDFGIAKATQQELTEHTVFTQFREFIGTPAYMSPEQAEMSELGVDTRCDIYSLGVLLYELLTGKTPFDTRELMAAGYEEMRRRIREQEPPRPSTKAQTMAQEDLTTVARKQGTGSDRLIRRLSGELDWIVMKALEKDRTRRYETANGFALDVERFLQDEPVLAVAPSRWYRFRKFARRNKVALATGSAFALLLIAATIGTGVLAYRERQANEALEIETTRAQDAERKASDQRDLAIARREEARLNLYVADIPTLMTKSFSTRGLGEILDTHIPRTPDEGDYRGFEWRYLYGLTMSSDLPPEARVFKGHSDMVMAIGFSPDGRWLASGSRDSRVIVWDYATGQPIHRIPHPTWVNEVQFSPDSRLLATVSENTLSVWDISGPSHRLVARRKPPLESASPILFSTPIRFSPGGDWIACQEPREKGEQDDRVVLWNYLEQRSELTLTNAGLIRDLSRDGSVLITEASDHSRTFRFWDLPNTGRLIGAWTNRFASLSITGTKLVGSELDSVKIYDLRAALGTSPDQLDSLKPQVIRKGAEQIGLAKLSPDERFLYLISNDRKQIWDVVNDEPVPFPKTFRDWYTFSRDGSEYAGSIARTNVIVMPTRWKARTNAIPDIEIDYRFTPDGKHLMVQRRGRPIELLDPSTMESIRTFDSLPPELGNPAVSPDGNSLFASHSGKLFMVDFQSGRIIREADLGYLILPGRFSHDGRFYACVLFDGTLKVLDAKTLDPVQERILADKVYGTMDARFSPDGRWLAAVADYKNLKLFDTTTWETETIPNQHTIIGYVQEGKRLLTWTTWGKVFEINFQTGERKDLFPTQGSQVGFAISPDEKTLATGGYDDNSLRLWNLRTGRLLATIEIEARLPRLAFSPDGKLLIAIAIPRETYGKDWHGTLHYWRAPSFEEIEFVRASNP